MSDIVERLRAHRADTLDLEAADEIDRLRDMRDFAVQSAEIHERRRCAEIVRGLIRSDARDAADFNHNSALQEAVKAIEATNTVDNATETA